MLPPGCQWIPRYQHAGAELALELDGKCVAMLLARVGGGWSARLECHWPIEAPLVMRRCSSYEAGRAGVEAWAVRHVDGLRAELADPVVARARWERLAKAAAGGAEG